MSGCEKSDAGLNVLSKTDAQRSALKNQKASGFKKSDAGANVSNKTDAQGMQALLL